MNEPPQLPEAFMDAFRLGKREFLQETGQEPNAVFIPDLWGQGLGLLEGGILEGLDIITWDTLSFYCSQFDISIDPNKMTLVRLGSIVEAVNGTDGYIILVHSRLKDRGLELRAGTQKAYKCKPGDCVPGPAGNCLLCGDPCYDYKEPEED